VLGAELESHLVLQLWTDLVLVVQEELLFVAEMESHLVLHLWTGLGVAFQDSQLLAVIAELVVLFQVLVLVVVIADWSHLVAEFGD